MSKYTNMLFEQGTPQSQPVPASVSTAPQAPNNAGGVVFVLDKWKRLERFLILGSDGNTYYQKAEKLTKQNAACVTECWTEDAQETANVIRSISLEGRAPRNSPAIFALALGTIHKDESVRKFAFNSVNSVCRTSTHLFEFVDTCRKLGKGWGRGLKNAVANWYNSKTDDHLAYQLVKYRQREGYTHERLIRLAHPSMEATSDFRKGMYDWLRGREPEHIPEIIRAHAMAMSYPDAATDDPSVDNAGAVASLAREFRLPWEALPTWANTKPEVWRAMLPTMPLNALIRNLGNMTRLGVFNDSDYADEYATGKLMSDRELHKARIHPFNILNAAGTYESGKGFRGNHVWTPKKNILRGLEIAFKKSFKTVAPSNKRIMLALDISGSMDGSMLFNSNLSARVASAAMAKITLDTEPVENVRVVGFTSLGSHNTYMGAIAPLAIHQNMPLINICRYTDDLPHAGTDCSLPMLYAMQGQMEIDAFVVYTDSETWAGRIQPVEALRRYRERSGIDAKLIVVGMTSNGFTIADPNDAGMLDIVGFDSSAPAVIADFLRSHDGHALLEDNTSATLRTEEEEPEA